jgi:uncharacterized protein
VQEDQNYGRSPEPGEATGAPVGDDPSGGATSPQDERRWSILAHLSVLAWPVAGFLPVAPLILWLVYRDRSPRVGFHALQSLWYQVAWMVILAVGWTVAGILTVVLIGFLLFPVMIVATLVPFVHMGYAAYKVSQGMDYRYPFIADMIDNNRSSNSV